MRYVLFRNVQIAVNYFTLINFSIYLFLLKLSDRTFQFGFFFLTVLRLFEIAIYISRLIFYFACFIWKRF